MTTYAKTIGLAGDGDEIEFIEELELIFGVTFDTEQLEEMQTVDDLYKHIVEKLGNVSTERKGCHSSLMFRRLRAAIKKNVLAEGVTPETPLKEVIPDRKDISPILRQLEKETGLTIKLYGSEPMLSILIIVFAVFIGMLIAIPEISLLMTIAIATSMTALYVALPEGEPVYSRSTIRDLIDRNTYRNFSSFSEYLGGAHPQDVMHVIQKTAQDLTGEKQIIGPETRFY